MKNVGAFWQATLLIGLVFVFVSWYGLTALGQAPDPSQSMEAYNRWENRYCLIATSELLGICTVVAGLLSGLSAFLANREISKLQLDDA